MIITQKAIPRRTVLRGLGASLALPLLDGMVPAFAALRNTAASPVRRYGVVYVPNGVVINEWTPKLDGSAFDFTPILKPLEPFDTRANGAEMLAGDPVNILMGRRVGGFAHAQEIADIVERKAEFAGVADEFETPEGVPVIAPLIALRPFRRGNQPHVFVISDGRNLDAGSLRYLADGKHRAHPLKL